MGRKNKANSLWENAYKNRQDYMLYVDRLKELSIAMFEWKNLPDTVDERFLELTLFEDGNAVFFNDDAIGYLTLQAMLGGRLDVYRIPTYRKAYSANGYQQELNPDNSVIIFNNMIHTNSYLAVLDYARKLWALDRAIEVNANAQKTPVLIKCDEKQKLTLENIYMQYEGNSPVIYGYTSLDPNSFSVLKTDAPYIADKLYTLKTQIWNEALTYLGISNVSFQKKERLVSDEAIRSAGGTIASRYSRLNARRQACKMINKMFGLNIECNFREDYREADDEMMFAGDTGDKSLDTMAVDLRTN